MFFPVSAKLQTIKDGDSYSLGTMPSTDASKKLNNGNQILVLIESRCISAWLFASVW